LEDPTSVIPVADDLPVSFRVLGYEGRNPESIFHSITSDGAKSGEFSRDVTRVTEVDERQMAFKFGYNYSYNKKCYSDHAYHPIIYFFRPIFQ
jgi:hypothetical protein